MFYMYKHHHITPDEFAKKDTLTQRLLVNFTQIECELDDKERKEYENLRKNK